MAISRRAFLAASVATAISSLVAPASWAAQGDGGVLSDLLSGVADSAARRYIEQHADEGRWDGKYYYDEYDNKRYTRDQWRKELERRANAEKSGRDWRDSKRRAWEENRRKNRGNNRHNDDDRRSRRDDRDDRRNDRRDDRDDRRDRRDDRDPKAEAVRGIFNAIQQQKKN